MDKGLTIKALAGIIGVSEDTMINWERRGRVPRGGNLEKVSEFAAVVRGL